MKKVYLRIMLLSCLGLLAANCTDGEDGLPGADATADGADGADGVDGVDGVDGGGFDELAKYGGIVVSVAGTVGEDNVSFANEKAFMFTTVSGDDILQHNAYSTYQEEEEVEDGEEEPAEGEETYTTFIDFDMQRYLTNPGDLSSRIELDFGASTTSDGTFAYEYIRVGFDNMTITTDNNEYILFDDYFDEDSIANLQIQEYSFDEETNTLTFSLSFNVSPSNNSTGHDLSVSIEANVILLKEVEDPDEDEVVLV